MLLTLVRWSFGVIWIHSYPQGRASGGVWVSKHPTHKVLLLRLAVFPIVYMVFYIPGV